MKLLTFLGATAAYETTYYLPDNREHTAPFCGVALARFYPDSDMRVFVTEDAWKTHWERFRALAEDHVASLQAVRIDDGKNEAELWKVFQAVVDHVDTGEAVIFDITHGFRSLPFLSFLAAAYLRVVKSIRLEAVLYGNYEARDKSVTPNRAPVVDLTRFVDLLDWMVAADRFIRFGDAHDLAERLRAAKPSYPHIQRDPLLQEDAKRLGLAAKALDEVSLALRLIRPNDAMDASNRLQTRLVDAVPSIQIHARPFVPLVQDVVDTYAPLSLGKKDQQSQPVEALSRERRLVAWYAERRQYAQAMALAREWVVSWAMVHAGITDLREKELRAKTEEALGQALNERRRGSKKAAEIALPTGRALSSLPDFELALQLYHEVGDARNDLLHAGNRPDAREAETLERLILSLGQRLSELPLPE